MKHLLITGASSGIGRAFVSKAIASGARISITGRDAGRLTAVWQQVPTSQRGVCQAVELQDAAALRDFCLQLQLCRDPQTNKAMPITDLVLCAGLNSSRSSAHRPEYRAIEQMMAVNFLANVRLIEALLPTMVSLANPQCSPSILALLSTCCLYSNANLAAYSASKAALDAYLNVLRRELEGSGVRVLSMYPGGTDTEFRPNARPDYLAAEDVADAMLAMLQAPANAQWHQLVLRPAVERNYG